MTTGENLPSFLTSSTAEAYGISIRLRANGLTFLLHQSTNEDPIWQTELTVEAGHPDMTTAIKELFFRNPFLTYPYMRCKLYYEPTAYTLVPADLYEEEGGDRWLSVLLEEPENDGYTTTEGRLTLPYTWHDGNQLILSAYNRALWQFIRRTIIVAEPIPAFIPTLDRVLALTDRDDRRNLIFIAAAGFLDTILLTKGELSFANRFRLSPFTDSATLTGELVFYLFSLWRTLNLEAEKDSLYISLDDDLSGGGDEFVREAKMYVRKVVSL